MECKAPAIKIETNGDLIKALSAYIAAHEACAAKIKALADIYSGGVE